MINELEKAYNYYSKIIIIYACRISDEEKELVAIAQGLHICVTCELYRNKKLYSTQITMMVSLRATMLCRHSMVEQSYGL
jgi:hypothetical protein